MVSNESNVSSNGTSETKLIKVASWSNLEIYPVPQTIYSLLCSYITVVTLVSIAFNGTVIVTTLKCKKLRRPLNYMLLNLAVADFLSAAIGGSISILANAATGFFMGRFVCVMDGFLVGTFGIANLISIVFLSISRLIVVCKPCGHDKFSRKHALIAVIITWIWAIAWSSVPMFWGAYDLEGIGTSCGLIIENSKDLRSGIHLVSYFVFCFLLPVLIMFIAYTWIIVHVWKSSRSNPVASGTSSRAQRMEVQTTKMVIVIMLAFLMCWTPYGCVAMHLVLRPDVKFRRTLCQFIQDRAMPPPSSGTGTQGKTSGLLRVAYNRGSRSRNSSSVLTHD